MGTLGIIAGQGQLPALLIQACNAQQRPFFVLALEGQTEPDLLEGVDHTWIGLGEIGKGIDALKRHNVTQLVLAGGVKRPSLASLKMDWRGTKLLARVGLRALGDDALLRLIVEELTQEGITVVGAQTCLASLQCSLGPLGTHTPSPQATADIEWGIRVLTTLSPLDIGQAVVVQQGVVLGIEAAEGTDALIQRCAALQKPGHPATLIKMAKQHQDERVDLPTLGPDTLEQVLAAGMAGIAFEAAKALLLDADRLRGMADQGGVFLMGVSGEKG